MNSLKAETEQLLQRTDLNIPFQDFLTIVESTYPIIGKIVSYDPILQGYEAANFRIHTTKDAYVLKIFEANRAPANIRDMVRILVEAPSVGVPVPVLIEGTQGNLSHFSPPSDPEVPYYLTVEFQGKNYENRIPTFNEMQRVTGYLAQLNTLNFPVTEAYDSWGNKNLVQEFEKNKESLLPLARSKIEEVAEEVRAINLSILPKRVIHGDMQSKHVLRNDAGDLCILDFGCMSYDARIVDLSTHLAWFCLSEANWEDRENIISSILAVYSKTHQLSKQELSGIVPLIRASYAAYYMKTNQLIQEGDDSQETRDWNVSSRSLLEMSKSLKDMSLSSTNLSGEQSGS
ncbi:MAG TPA: phosphotransferase [Candidatus Bathyarchaeia archaeon]|nr:phosphotransferase [Candidatus Bathyarchaeia archaeon]